MQSDLILIRPIITEKTMQLVDQDKFTFQVNPLASKSQIAQIIKTHFKVDVIGITTTKIKGKAKKMGRKRLVVQQSDSKKAVVQLAKGQKIDLFDIEDEKKKKKK